MKILTVRQPWASAIMQLKKDVENRVWTTNYRGIIYIHAGYYKPTELDFAELLKIVSPSEISNINWITGAILGHVTLTNIIRNSQSKWALPNQYHWLLSEPILLDKPIYCKGQLGLWNFSLPSDF